MRVGQNILETLLNITQGYISATENQKTVASSLFEKIGGQAQQRKPVQLVFQPGAGILGEAAKMSKEDKSTLICQWIEAGLGGCTSETDTIIALAQANPDTLFIVVTKANPTEAKLAVDVRAKTATIANIAYVDDAEALSELLGVMVKEVAGRDSEHSRDKNTYKAFVPTAVKISSGGEIVAVVEGRQAEGGHIKEALATQKAPSVTPTPVVI